jgi:two-component SAPR family response regulator
MLKIVVIDDENAALNTFLGGVIDRVDFSYQMFCNDPLSSIEYVKKNHVDVAFIDICMPIINGIELALKLIEIQKSILIVFISSYAQDKAMIRESVGENLVGFCPKPYDTDDLNLYLQRARERINSVKEVKITMFGEFDVFLDNIPVKFTSKKSKELMSLLVDRNGGYVSMESAILSLWPDNNPENGKRLYRDAVYKLRRDLIKVGLDIIDFGWAKLRIIISDNIKCDYWEYLKNNTQQYNGAYLCSYEWSLDTQNFLDNLYPQKD